MCFNLDDIARLFNLRYSDMHDNQVNYFALRQSCVSQTPTVQ